MINKKNLDKMLRGAVSACALMGAAASWAAPMVSYSTQDLVDAVVGQDLRRNVYTVSGPIDAFGGVTLAFIYGAYDGLMISSGDADLDLSTPPVQPDPLGDGLVTVTWLADMLASASAQFTVDFVWLGSGAPGTQGFEVFDGFFNLTSSGRTVAASGGTVPEPAALLLLFPALAAAAFAGRRAVPPQAAAGD